MAPDLAAELQALEAMPESEIATSEIPVARDWTGAEGGRFCRPVKRQITLRLDADLVAFFEAQGRSYRTRINAALLELGRDASAGDDAREGCDAGKHSVERGGGTGSHCC